MIVKNFYKKLFFYLFGVYKKDNKYNKNKYNIFFLKFRLESKMEKKEENDNEVIHEIDLIDKDMQHILIKNLPDKNTEFFWYGFKNTIINLVNTLKIEMKDNEKNEKIKNKDKEAKLNYIIKDLEERSNLYNEMQKENKFKEINIEIENYIKYISRIFFIKYADDYHFNIYLTNIKRWSKLSNQTKYDWLDIKTKTKNNDNTKTNEDDYFMIFFNIRKYFCERHNNNKNLEENDNMYIEDLKRYDDNLYIKNKLIMGDIYKSMLRNKYLKPSILLEFGKYFPIISDLQKIGCIKEDIDLDLKYSNEKILKKYFTNPNSPQLKKKNHS